MNNCLVLLVLALGRICLCKNKIPDVVRSDRAHCHPGTPPPAPPPSSLLLPSWYPGLCNDKVESEPGDEP